MARRFHGPDFGPRLADCNGSGHGAYQLPERGRGSDPNYGDNQNLISDSSSAPISGIAMNSWRRPHSPKARLAEFRRHQLEGGRLFERREAGAHRRGVYAPAGSTSRESCAPARRTRWPFASKRTARRDRPKRRQSWASAQRRSAGRGQPDVSLVGWLGLDAGRARPRHRHLEQRVPDWGAGR